MESYHGIEEVHSVDGEADSAIKEAAHFEVKPALWIAFVGSALRIDCRPDAVVIVCGAFYFSHISRVEDTVEEDVGLSGLGEVEFGALRNKGWVRFR